jgi:hypothetical protein
MIYRTQHTRDCVLCDDVGVVESELVDLIRKDEVPVIRSTMSPNGKVTTCVERMTKGFDYIAISHVWAGGLGNSVRNELPQCQLQTIHEDVGHAMSSRLSRMIFLTEFAPDSEDLHLQLQKMGRLARLPSSPASTTVRYWMDTLCIPTNIDKYADEKERAINSMGRVYAGAAAVLVLDPTLRSISYD